MWTVELPPAQKAEVSPLIAALEYDGTRAPVIPFYEALAAELAPHHPPTIELGTEESHYQPSAHKIVLDYLEPGQEVYIGRTLWAQRLTAAFWHEMGHAIHSRRIADPGDSETALALNYLEDIRLERRMVDDFGDRARAWLRFNALDNKADFAIEADADVFGWAPVATTFAGRRLAGTVLAADLDTLLARFPEAKEEISVLTPVWEAYLALEDDQLDLDHTMPWSEALAKRIK